MDVGSHHKRVPLRRTSRNAEMIGGLGSGDPPQRPERRSPQTGHRFLIFGPAAAFTAIGILFGQKLPGWMDMWLVAAVLFFAAKWITLAKLFASGRPPRMPRVIAYAFFWPGLNAHAFCFGRVQDAPARGEAVAAFLKMSAGAALIWAAAELANTHCIVAGWMAMIGIVLFLHFGAFQLLSIFWRGRGVNAQPLMRAPAKATSVANFWANRWNTAFADLMRAQIFTPVARRHGLAIAVAIVFGISGLLHELVISVPARGGYGLPGAYFALQCFAVRIERSRFGTQLGLGRGFAGWCFVLISVGLPAVILFPPVFVHNVIAPMLQIITRI
jgi:hypothetical protein